MAYQLRKREEKNYKDLSGLRAKKNDDRLYELEVVEDEYSGWVKVLGMDRYTMNGGTKSRHKASRYEVLCGFNF